MGWTFDVAKIAMEEKLELVDDWQPVFLCLESALHSIVQQFCSLHCLFSFSLMLISIHRTACTLTAE